MKRRKMKRILTDEDKENIPTFKIRGDNQYGSFMKYWNIIEMSVIRNNDLNRHDLKLLFYLESFEYYTSKAVRDGSLMIPAGIKRHQRLLRDGWLKCIYTANRRRGEHNKYTLTVKAKLLVTKIYKQLIGQAPIPESIYNNRIFKKEKKVDAYYMEAIKLFNRDKSR